MTNIILVINFNFFKSQILYSIAKLVPYESEKVIFSRIWISYYLFMKYVLKNEKYLSVYIQLIKIIFPFSVIHIISPLTFSQSWLVSANAK